MEFGLETVSFFLLLDIILHAGIEGSTRESRWSFFYPKEYVCTDKCRLTGKPFGRLQGARCRCFCPLTDMVTCGTDSSYEGPSCQRVCMRKGYRAGGDCVYNGICFCFCNLWDKFSQTRALVTTTTPAPELVPFDLLNGSGLGSGSVDCDEFDASGSGSGRGSGCGSGSGSGSGEDTNFLEENEDADVENINNTSNFASGSGSGSGYGSGSGENAIETDDLDPSTIWGGIPTGDLISTMQNSTELDPQAEISMGLFTIHVEMNIFDFIYSAFGNGLTWLGKLARKFPSKIYKFVFTQLQK